MKKYRSMMISSYMLVAFAGGVGAQQNNPVVNAPPESAPAAEGCRRPKQNRLQMSA